MLPELQQGFDVIERQRIALQQNLSALSVVQRHWTLSPGTWNVEEIAEHLVLSDETLGQARDAETIKPEARMFRVLPRSLRRALVLRAFERNVALPLPSPDIKPQGQATLSELMHRWETARDKMRCALETMQAQEQRYTHPVLGPLTAAQMLELEQTHTAYHLRQIQALQNHPSFPRNTKT